MNLHKLEKISNFAAGFKDFVLLLLRISVGNKRPTLIINYVKDEFYTRRR